MNNRKNRVIVIGLLFLIEIAVYVLLANEKVAFFQDELYTMGYASACSGVGDTSTYITTSELWNMGEWIDIDELREYLIVRDEESLFNQSFSRVIRTVLTYNNYECLLNVVNSSLGIDNISKWPGIVLNIIIVLLTQLVIWAIMSELKLSDCCKLLMLISYGLCGIMCGMVMYIRFYSLTILWMWLAFYLTLLVMKMSSIYKCIGCEILSLLCILFAINNSQLVIILAGGVVGLASVFFLIKKQWFKLIPYILAALVVVWNKIELIKVILSPATYASSDGSAVGWVTDNVVNASLSSVKTYFELLINQQLNNISGWYSISVITVSVLLLVEAYYFGEYLAINKILVKCCYLAIVLTMFAFLLWKGRVTMLLALCVVLFVALVIPALKSIGIANMEADVAFVLILSIVAIVYTVFASLAGLAYDTRYYSYGIIITMFVEWCIIDRTIKISNDKQHGLVYALCVVVTLITIVSPVLTDNVGYLYREDKQIIQRLAEEDNLDSIVYETNVEACYDCISLVGTKSQILVVDEPDYNLDDVPLPNTFLVWGARYKMTDEYNELIKSIEEKGYLSQSFGTTHESMVYLCTAKDSN